MWIKCRSLEGGAGPSEAIVAITRADGREEQVIVYSGSVRNGEVEVSVPLSRDLQNNRVLIELPRESCSGSWRIWIPASAVPKHQGIGQ